VNVPEAVDAFVRQLFEESKRQLLHVADMEGGELFEQALNRLLLRWDAERPASTADYILRHGLTKDGQLAVTPPPAIRTAIATTRGMSINWRQKWTKTQLAK
jgi:hypothetical protein